jgi:hypothetical protein
VWCTLIFTFELPDSCKTASNIRMELSCRLLKLSLMLDTLTKIIFVSDQWANIVCALQQCIKLNCSSHIINNILRNTFKKEFLDTSLLHTDLLTPEIKEVVIYLKLYCLIHHPKTVTHQCVGHISTAKQTRTNPLMPIMKAKKIL